MRIFKGPLPPSILCQGKNQSVEPSSQGPPLCQVKRKCGRPRNPIPRHKRDSHIMAEHRRRGKIQECFHTLKKMVPRYVVDSGRNSKSNVLLNAVDHCRLLQEEVTQLDSAIGGLRAEVASLTLDMRDCDTTQPQATVKSAASSASLDQLFHEFVTAHKASWPADGFLLRTVVFLFESYKRCVSGQSSDSAFAMSVSRWAMSTLDRANLASVCAAALRKDPDEGSSVDTLTLPSEKCQSSYTPPNTEHFNPLRGDESEISDYFKTHHRGPSHPNYYRSRDRDVDTSDNLGPSMTHDQNPPCHSYHGSQDRDVDTSDNLGPSMTHGQNPSCHSYYGSRDRDVDTSDNSSQFTTHERSPSCHRYYSSRDRDDDTFDNAGHFTTYDSSLSCYTYRDMSDRDRDNTPYYQPVSSPRSEGDIIPKYTDEDFPSQPYRRHNSQVDSSIYSFSWNLARPRSPSDLQLSPLTHYPSQSRSPSDLHPSHLTPVRDSTRPHLLHDNKRCWSSLSEPWDSYTETQACAWTDSSSPKSHARLVEPESPGMCKCVACAGQLPSYPKDCEMQNGLDLSTRTSQLARMLQEPRQDQGQMTNHAPVVRPSENTSLSTPTPSMSYSTSPHSCPDRQSPSVSRSLPSLPYTSSPRWCSDRDRNYTDSHYLQSGHSVGGISPAHETGSFIAHWKENEEVRPHSDRPTELSSSSDVYAAVNMSFKPGKDWFYRSPPGVYN